MGQASQESGSIANAAAGAMHAVTDKAKELASSAGEFVGHAKDKAQELASAAAHSAGDAMQSAGHEITSVIRRYPVQSVLIGAALGYLLVKATSKG